MNLQCVQWEGILLYDYVHNIPISTIRWRLKSTSINYLRFSFHESSFVFNCRVMTSPSWVTMLRKLLSISSSSSVLGCRIPTKGNVGVIGYFNFISSCCPCKGISTFMVLRVYFSNKRSLMELWKLVLNIGFVWVLVIRVVITGWMDGLNES